MTRCGECPACRAEDCGRCQFCLDKPKFGGTYTLKKPCLQRECPYLSFAETMVPGRIPGEVGHVSAVKLPASASKSSHATTPAVAANTTTPKSKKRRRESTGTPSRTTPTSRSSKEQDDNNSSRKRRKLKDKTPTGKKKEAKVPKQKAEKEKNPAEDTGPVIVKFRIPKLEDLVSQKARKIIRGAGRDLNDSKVQDKACEHLRKLATSKDNNDKIILAGGIEMIANAMTQHPDKTIVQAEACATIAGMAWIDPSIATKLAHLGILERISSCMERLAKTNNTKVQQMGCGAFRALSYIDSNVPLIMDAGGLIAVLNSMKRNPKKLMVQQEGCYVLQNMLASGPNAVLLSSAIADTIVESESEIVPNLLDSMFHENADTEFREAVLSLVANLALHPKANTSMGRSSAVSTLIRILNNTTTDSPDVRVKLKILACSALSRIASNTENRQSNGMLSQDSGGE
eukprot:CAMPEP_0117004594 /NCGR_PEP_ID=MMETSP0472-20121206/5506_1 /TAXON_ID=693140 ORGANISM="Tiarina fusus, Strain LIS" /NCGR_SAMPLE_ID=MMETSP0472 /ASSEMBLY_ACC=CAM_ASM_000603 /LENGTH=457 /DNA_ID=CAMNT_0004705583 /DNA_START=16 /DNA_END=1386 /DNA_ORIENTATION=+